MPRLLPVVLAASVVTLLCSCTDPRAPANQVETEQSGTRYWVQSERADRRTCPSNECGLVGQLFFREAAEVYERQGDWARVTEPYSASCSGGRSDYVDEGNANCDPDNGIVDGQFAEWTLFENLSETRPADPAETASNAERLVANSDDFSTHRAAFVAAANELIADGTCRPNDFLEMGGWVKSMNEGRNEPVYFTYCGGMTVANRIYLNAATGRTYR